MTRKARSDRQSYGVYTRRGYWHGWYYRSDGVRVNGIPLTDTSGPGRLPTRLPVTKDPSTLCPNRFIAQKAIEAIWRAPNDTRKPIPPLVEAVGQWGSALILQGANEKNTRQRCALVNGVLSGAFAPGTGHKKATARLSVNGQGWQHFGDISRAGMRDFLASLSQLGRANSTLNGYLVAMRNFLDWCCEEGYINENPLKTMRKAKMIGNAYARRPFTREELAELLAHCPREHGIFFETLAFSGLRYSEARKLRKEHLEPIGDRPYWRLPSRIQKTKLPETLPMMPRLAKLLAQRWYCLKEGQLVFDAPPSYSDLFDDLRAAGIARKNAEGECIAYHSFRYFFCTELAKEMPITQVQILMRHKSLQLTANLYRRLHLRDNEQGFPIPDIIL
jgi:integrase